MVGIESSIEVIRQNAPKDTGNLAYNAVKGHWEGNDFIISIDQNIAPYTPYTIEPWKNGKNPNERWFEKLVVKVAEDISRKNNGVLKKL